MPLSKTQRLPEISHSRDPGNSYSRGFMPLLTISHAPPRLLCPLGTLGFDAPCVSRTSPRHLRSGNRNCRGFCLSFAVPTLRLAVSPTGRARLRCPLRFPRSACIRAQSPGISHSHGILPFLAIPRFRAIISATGGIALNRLRSFCSRRRPR